MITIEMLKGTYFPIECEIVKTHTEPSKFGDTRTYAYDIILNINGEEGNITILKEDLKSLVYDNKIYFRNYRYDKSGALRAKPKSNYTYNNRIQNIRESLISAYNTSVNNFKNRNTDRYTNYTIAKQGKYINSIEINNVDTKENMGNMLIEELAVPDRYWVHIKLDNKKKNIIVDTQIKNKFLIFYSRGHRISINNIVEHMFIENIKK